MLDLDCKYLVSKDDFSLVLINIELGCCCPFGCWLGVSRDVVSMLSDSPKVDSTSWDN